MYNGDVEKINTFEEVKYALKSREIITSNGSDTFYLKDGIVTRKFNGSSYSLKVEDFLELYKDVTFYKMPEIQNTVDEEKDIEYYGRIQKMN